MRQFLRFCLGSIALVVLCGMAAAAPGLPAPVEGTWRTLNGTEVTVAPCPQGYCGTLSWIVVPSEEAGLCHADRDAFRQLLLDYRNANKSLQTRPLLGAPILTLKPTGDPTTYTATIYNAEDGKSYDGLIWVVDGNRVLRLGGGCLVGLCAVTQDWPRVPDREGTPDFTCQGS